AARRQPLDRTPELELDTDLPAALGQPRRKKLAVAGFVAGEPQRADQLVGDASQRRLGAREFAAFEQLERHADFAQHLDVACRRLELLPGAEHLQRAALAALVLDSGLGAQRAQAVAAVLGEPQ